MKLKKKIIKKKKRIEDVPLVEFMYLVFICMPGESYHRQLRSLLYLCYIFQALCVEALKKIIYFLLT